MDFFICALLSVGFLMAGEKPRELKNDLHFLLNNVAMLKDPQR